MYSPKEYVIVLVVLALMTVWITYRYLSIFFTAKNKSFLAAILWGCYLVFQIWSEFPNDLKFIYIFILNVTIQVLIAYTCFYGENSKKIIFVMLLMVIWTISEMLVYQILVRIPVSETGFTLLGSVMSKLFAMIITGLIRIRYGKRESDTIPTPFFWGILMLPLFSMGIAYNIFILQSSNDYTMLSMVSYSLLIVMNIMVYELFERLIKSIAVENENAMFEQQLSLLIQHNEMQQATNEKLDEFRHNFKNQILVLKNVAEKEPRENILKIIEEMSESTSTSLQYLVKSGNDLVDAVLNNKCTLAISKEIEVKTKVFVPMELPYSQSDIGIIVGNAMDNAIEALDSYTGKKFLEVYMGVKKNSFIIVIKNPYQGEQIKDLDGNFLTRKRDGRKHGYGLRSIRRMVEKYNGELLVEAKDKIFYFTVILPLL